MVDLVKIRRKAKEKKEREQAAVAASASPAAVAPSLAEGKAGEQPLEDRLALYKESLGIRRIEAPRRAVAPASGEGSLEVLLFMLAGEQYAIPIEKISEIIEPREVTRIPNADPAVSGIISLRGTIVTIVDAGSRVGHAVAKGSARDSAAAGPDSRIVVTERQGELTGFVVDRVLRVLELDERQLETPPLLDASEQRDAIRSLFRLDGALAVLLDLEKLLA